MAALVVVEVSREVGSKIPRLDIFPGGATPSVFPARTAFWIGYGFAPDAATTADAGHVGAETHFELDVDGRTVPLEADVRLEAGVVARKVEYADFETGLPAGWHTFAGRWFDRGKLLLSNRATIEFVDR